MSKEFEEMVEACEATQKELGKWRFFKGEYTRRYREVVEISRGGVMDKRKTRFKEGGLINATFSGIITRVYPGKTEKDTYYDVFIKGHGVVRQYQSNELAEREEEV